MTSAEALRLHCLDVILERSTPEPNTGCWLWAGAVSHNGYGVAWAAGKKVRANRFAWMVAHGPIAETLVSAIATGKCWVPRHHPNQNAGEG